MPYLKMKKIHHGVFSNQFFNYSNDRTYSLKRSASSLYRSGERSRKNSKRWVMFILRIIVGIGCFVTFELSYALCSGKNCSCSVEVMPVNFGNYSPYSTEATTGLGKITVNCAAQTAGQVSYTISLNTGAGRFLSRAMVLGSRRLQYNLYTDSAYQFIWGDGTVGTNVVNDAYPIIKGNNSKTYPVFGKIPAAQNIRVGVYTDILTLTVDY
jgi:spore coat protein U-like protein